MLYIITVPEFAGTFVGMFVSLSVLQQMFFFLSGISLDVMVAAQMKTGLYFGKCFF